MKPDKHAHFIELRAQGLSYQKISKQLNVSKPTLIKWSREHCTEIKNAKAVENERIREDYLLGRQHRTRVLGTQLNRITKEILKRDLTEVPTWRLFELQRKVINEIEKDASEVEFSRDTLLNPGDMMLDAMRKKQTWIG
jgi:transposase